MTIGEAVRLMGLSIANAIMKGLFTSIYIITKFRICTGLNVSELYI